MVELRRAEHVLNRSGQVNFVTIFKAVDAVMAFREAAKRVKDGSTRSPAEMAPPPAAVGGLAGQIETRLTNVVVAALKEAFDRDHARLELERGHLDEQRRRAEAALRLELRRQAADRELARLRLLAGAAMIGWLASVAMLAGGLIGSTVFPRALTIIGWLLLLGALGAAFTAQRHVGTAVPDDSPGGEVAAAGGAALWLLIAGLAATAVSLLL
jgi:hypothetical protein